MAKCQITGVGPKTGKRISRVNAESEWQTAAVPHLEIVNKELVDAKALGQRVADITKLIRATSSHNSVP